MPEFELSTILTAGRKQLPRGTVAKLQKGAIPGTVSVSIKLPGQQNARQYSNLEIKNKTILLPVRLAFLSYAKEDASFVRELSDRLLQDGVLTWFDEKDLLPGDKWKSRIDDAIERSDFVIVVLSSTSVTKTGYFQRELKYALEQCLLRPDDARYLIPLIIDDCQPPKNLGEIHWLRAKVPNWYERLLTSLLGQTR